MDQHFPPLKLIAAYLRGMIPWPTNSSLDLLCCSFSWRTEQKEKDKKKKQMCVTAE